MVMYKSRGNMKNVLSPIIGSFGDSILIAVKMNTRKYLTIGELFDTVCPIKRHKRRMSHEETDR
jgi:hypothetical protein